MNKLKNISKKLVIFLVIFSFLVGIFPLIFNTETVYAKKNKAKEACYVIIADDYDTFKDLGVTDGSKAKIAVLSTSMVFTTTPPFDSTDKAQKIFKNLSNASHAEVIYIPSSKAWTDSKKQKTNDSAIKFGYDKGQTARNIMNKFSGVSKKDKFVTKFQSYTGNNGNAYLMTGYIGKMNLGLSYYMAGKDEKGDKVKGMKKVGATLIEAPSAINGDKSGQAEMLVTLLKNSKSNAFAYLTADSTKKDSSGNLVSSDSSDNNDNGTNEILEFKNTKEVFDKCGKNGDDEHVKYLEAYAVFLYGQNYSKACIAGILGNAMKETGVDPKYSGKKYCGMFCFTPSMFSDKYVQKCSHSKFTAVNGKPICADGSCQIIMAAEALGTNAKGAYGGQQSKMNDFLTNYKASGKYSIPKKLSQTIKNLDDYKQLDSPEDAAMLWMLCFERNKGIYLPTNQDGCQAHPDQQSGDYTYRGWFELEFNNNKNGRPYMAKVIADWLGSSAFDDVGQDSLNKASEMAEEAQKKGYLSEEELSSWTKIVNEKFINYKDVTRNNLNQSELSSLSRWEHNVKYDDLENHGVFHIFRWLFMVMAILMMIWSVLLYCAYWMDKVNPFCLPFSFVSFLTMGKLETAPTEEECNFTTRGLFKEKDTKSKFINHKYMLFVCLSMIFFSVLILTGTLYKIILSVIGFVAGIFGF